MSSLIFPYTVYFVLRAHLNSYAKFSSGILDLYLCFSIKSIVKKTDSQISVAPNILLSYLVTESNIYVHIKT